MHVKTAMVSLLSAALVSFGGSGMAQNQHQHEGGAKGPQGPGAMMGGEMMEGGMMGSGMMDMMQRCERMMGARGGHAMPQLPPGNEKLQLQMQAEMMQRVGEILAKYAAQLK